MTSFQWEAFAIGARFGKLAWFGKLARRASNGGGNVTPMCFDGIGNESLEHWGWRPRDILGFALFQATINQLSVCYYDKRSPIMGFLWKFSNLFSFQSTSHCSHNLWQSRLLKASQQQQNPPATIFFLQEKPIKFDGDPISDVTSITTIISVSSPDSTATVPAFASAATVIPSDLRCRVTISESIF